jgi:hypothetical protein
MASNPLLTCWFIVYRYITGYQTNIKFIKAKNSNLSIIDKNEERIDRYNLLYNYYEEDIEDQKYKYKCGNCQLTVGAAIFMYNDETFCSPRCRNAKIVKSNKIDTNYKSAEF